MKKINLTIGVLLVGSLFLATNFVACGGGGGGTGAAGTGSTGAAGTGSNNDASATGAAGTGSTVTDGGNSATSPDGKCVTGAYPRDGVCMCQPSNPDVCSMKCTDMKVDNANCGSCGKVCPATATCNNGMCGAEPTNVVPAALGCTSIHLAVGDGKIYFTDEGHKTVNSVAVAGGAVTKISTETGAPTWVALRGTGATATFFWLAGGKTIRKSVAGAAATDVVTSTTAINGFTVSTDGTKVYYSSTTKVSMVPAAGGTPIIVASEEHEGIPGALALDGTTMVYPTDQNGDVDIVYLMDGKIATCGAENDAGAVINVACTRIARSQGSLLKTSVLAFGGRVYWIDGGAIKAGDSAATAVPTNDPIASTLEQNITAMAANATTIYFGEDGIIEKTPLMKDSTAVQLARGQKTPTSIAVDATKVYWSTGDCTINATAL